jgi:hypothetical protein
MNDSNTTIDVKNIILFIGAIVLNISILKAQNKTVGNAVYRMEVSRNGISSFASVKDTVSLMAKNSLWGDVLVNYQVREEDWNRLTTSNTHFSQINEHSFLYTDSIPDMPLCMKRTYSLSEEGLRLKIELATTGKQAVELGDVILPIRMKVPGNKETDPDPKTIFEGGFISKHSISLNSSFISFSKPSGKGPFYLMLTGKGTPLEFFDNSDNTYKVYIHSACTGAKTNGNWRWLHTSKILAPAGEKGSSITYEFLLLSVPSYEGLREAIYQHGLLDVRAAPGYAVPCDLSVQVALRLKGKIDAVVPEFPEQTEVKSLGQSPNGAWLYDIRFNRLGENLLTVHYDKAEKTVLEFFSTEPVETLIKKRSAFIVNHQQHKVPGKWWDGLYSVYDMKYGKLRGPEDTDGFDGWWGYVLASDDPALGKAPFVAAKNVVYPDSLEIASVEYYIKNFVWGKLQRTDKERPYPYAIYGVPNWHVARDSILHAPYGNERPKIWRAYDYPHIVKLYYHMYQIAKHTPQWTHYLNAEEYLERSVQTAFAYFKYPYEVWSWFDIYKWGIYNERIIPELVVELQKRGRQKDADFLRKEWEKKAKYFIYDDKYPYRSEHSFDRTAFESSYALAKYAIENPMKPDQNLWYDKNKKIWYSHPRVTADDAKRFMDQQHYAGLAVRGWLEPKYYLAGTDARGADYTKDMSYMAMMGGWSILEYGLFYSTNKDWLELGYNSYLSSWSLMNTGDNKSNYGYWYPGKEKDGATGWAFVSAKRGMTWIRKQEDRGVWRYDGEIDLGYGAAFHTARTIIVQDLVFGLHAYGGDLTKTKSALAVIPKDGVRQNFSFVIPEYRFHLTLKRDGFLADHPLQMSLKNKTLEFTLENRNPFVGANKSSITHTTVLEIRSMNVLPKQVFVADKSLPMKKTETGWEIEIPVSSTRVTVKIIWD